MKPSVARGIYEIYILGCNRIAAPSVCYWHHSVLHRCLHSVQAASLSSKPALDLVFRTLLSVLQHLHWKVSLQEELLAAMDSSRERHRGMDDTLRQIRQ